MIPRARHARNRGVARPASPSYDWAPTGPKTRRTSMLRRALGASVVLLLLAVLAQAAPAPGLVESWPDSGSTDLWGGGAVYANPGHGGAGGDSDGYLKITTTFAGNLGTRSNGTTYVGDWLAAG